MRREFLLAGVIGAVLAPGAGAAVIFDDFNTSLGHFNSNITTASGSNTNMGTGSTSTRITTDSIEGGGSNQLAIVPTTPATTMRLRHLSGGGTVANNTAFTTGPGEDGWIGFYLKTSDPGYNVQLWIEGPSNNGGVPKNVIADGQWHLYEWNLDDNSGGPDGWGTIAGVATGVATVSDGSHTIDSIIFRNASAQNSTILLDFVAKSDSGSVAGLVPEPSMLGVLGVIAIAGLRRRR